MIFSNDIKVNSMMDILMQKINQMDKTIMIMQTKIDNYIVLNDLTLQAINETLQYVVNTSMVIIVPNSDEIDSHRSEFSKMAYQKMALRIN